MTTDQTPDGAHRAWRHYKRTGVILPTYQSVIADRIARGAETGMGMEPIEESVPKGDRQPARS